LVPVKIHVPEPILRRGKSLREEEICLILGSDMGDAPLISVHLNRRPPSSGSRIVVVRSGKADLTSFSVIFTSTVLIL
jgi:hypothetical protein